jgi:hypothetical protein
MSVEQFHKAECSKLCDMSVPPPCAKAPEVIVTKEVPVVDAPVVDAPVVDAPVVDAPVVDAPVVDAPVVDAQIPEKETGFFI